VSEVEDDLDGGGGELVEEELKTSYQNVIVNPTELLPVLPLQHHNDTPPHKNGAVVGMHFIVHYSRQKSNRTGILLIYLTMWQDKIIANSI
jgi:hypothetical protein